MSRDTRSTQARTEQRAQNSGGRSRRTRSERRVRVNRRPATVCDHRAVENELDALVLALEDGPLHRFTEWPATHLEIGPSGVYTIWADNLFVYVGMSYAHRNDADKVKAKGVFGRLASHASGRRSGDQFCVYVCDRFVIPRLTPADKTALADGERLLDARTRAYIHDEFGYRVIVTESGNVARELESRIRREGLPRSGRPLINP